MKILADESVDKQIVEQLRRDGHNVEYIAESSPGSTDIAVLDRANKLSALLITADKDFGELVFEQGLANLTGIVLIRLSGMSAERKAEIVSKVFKEHEEELSRAFSVITPGRVRIQSEH